jgi:hypothetical protein
MSMSVVSHPRRSFLQLVLGLALAPAVGAVEKPRRLSVTIEAGSAPATLAEFIRQTGLQLLFEADAIRGFRTHAVRGEADAAEALRLMLEGSGLVFEFINERTIAIRPQTLPHPMGRAALVLR